VMIMRRSKRTARRLGPRAILILALVLLAAGIALIAASWLIPASTQEFDMYLAVGDHAGFNIDTSAIFFGMVTPNGQSTRTVTITNYANVTTRIELQTSGELARLVSFSNNSFSLAPGENSSVAVTASVPVDMPYGNYTGTLAILYFR